MKVMALGGVNRIGNSCYYLSLARQHFLLDCGKGGYGSYICNPDFDALLRTELCSLSQLDGIFLSHGHYDHVGSLSTLWEQGFQLPVYATQLTKALMDALLVDKFIYQAHDTRWKQVCRSIQNQQVNRSICAVPYYSSIQKGAVTITFYPAGHVPGAAMIYFESPEGNVLYTGDFHSDESALTEGYYLPNQVNPDVVILCGTHAKHPHYLPINSLEQDAEKIQRYLSRGKSVHLQVSQLTRGLETAHWIGTRMPQTKLYLDDHIWNLAQHMEEAGTAAVRPNFYRESDSMPLDAITIGGREAHSHQVGMQVKFSLHATYGDCLNLIQQLSPSVVFLVHSPDDTRGDGGLQVLIDALGNQVCVLEPICGHLYDTEL